MVKKIVRSKVNGPQVAKSWLDLGVLTVPLKYHSKKPKGGTGWNELRVTSDSISQHFKTGDNVGGLWGEPSNWIVDVDLDWDEACELAAYWLPETFIYGRNFYFKTSTPQRQKRNDCGDTFDRCSVSVTSIFSR